MSSHRGQQLTSRFVRHNGSRLATTLRGWSRAGSARAPTEAEAQWFVTTWGEFGPEPSTVELRLPPTPIGEARAWISDQLASVGTTMVVASVSDGLGDGLGIAIASTEVVKDCAPHLIDSNGELLLIPLGTGDARLLILDLEDGGDLCSAEVRRLGAPPVGR